MPACAMQLLSRTDTTAIDLFTSAGIAPTPEVGALDQSVGTGITVVLAAQSATEAQGMRILTSGVISLRDPQPSVHISPLEGQQ